MLALVPHSSAAAAVLIARPPLPGTRVIAAAHFAYTTRSLCSVATQTGSRHTAQDKWSRQPGVQPTKAQRQPGPAQTPRQQHQLQHPDPAADDLDLLAAAAAATGAANVAGAPHTRAPSPSTTAPAAAATIRSIPDAEPTYVLPAGRTLRYAAADKLQLSGSEMRDIGARLRTRRPGWRGPVLRVWRYGIDDLRLYQAIDRADLEGRVVVVDSTADADAVLTTYSKRTRKNVNLATARRAAAGAGVPLLVLPAMSAQRLVEAVGPLLELPTADAGDSDAGQQQWACQQQQQQQGPRFLRWDELEGDGSEELLQLMWCGGTADSSSSSRGDGPAGATAAAGGAAGGPSPRWRAWCEAQAASPACAQELFAAVRDADVEDAREGAVPANPTARAGERHRLPSKPLRPRSRIKRRQLRHDLAMQRVDW